MKLLIVTGISDANWIEWRDTIEIPLPQVSVEVQSALEGLQTKSSKKDITEALNDVLDSLDQQKPHCIFLPNCVPQLPIYLEHESVKSLVFYSDPELSVAHTLTDTALGEQDGLKEAQVWKQQLKTAFELYREHRQTCLLLNYIDVVENQPQSLPALAEFCQAKVTFESTELGLSSDRMLAAQLILQDQDDIFDFYDEIRSDAPIFGTFSVSGVAAPSQLSSLALKAIKQHQSSQKQFSQATQKQAAELSDVEKRLDSANNELIELKQQKQQLEDSNSELAAKLKELETQRTKSASQIEQLEADNELQVLQLNQLQEELEATHKDLVAAQKDQAEKAEQIKQLTGRLQEQTAQVKQATQESELQVLQIGQLQEELESGHSEHKKELTNLTDQINELNHASEVAHAKSKDSTQQLETVQNKLQHTEAECELLILQTVKLQEELESTLLKLERVEGEAQTATEQNQTQQQTSLLSQDKIEDLVAENEIATLQINQLQEELEFYYLQLQQKESAHMLHSQSDNKPIQKVFDKTAVGRAEMVAGYATDGYSDIQLRLENVALADGRLFDNIVCKLINVEGHVGIEFRAADSNVELRWLDDLKDEYGHYITFIPIPPESKTQQQQRVNEKLSAGERVVVLSIASLLNDALQLEDLSIIKPMEEGELRDWRLSAIELKNQIATLPQWMSFDQLSLVEEYRTDDYEHLWLRFEKLLVNDQLFPEFEVKFAATGKSSDTLFTDEITLEIRETPAGFGPLQAWPPELKDDYGYKFQAKVKLSDEGVEIFATDRTSQRDKQLIRHLFKNFIHFLPVLKAQGAEITRDNNDWLAVGECLSKIGGFAETNEQVEKEAVTNPTPFTFAEFVDLGGYQHLVFEYEIQPETMLKLKVRADNIDESGNADIAIDLRTGDDNVPLANSRHFDEDDYGPRVLFNLGDVEEIIFDDSLDAEHRNMLNEFIQALPALTNATSELDEKAQLLWSQWLKDL
ncbi:hypothetical protein [Aliiglaciecola litoralis]|uniref:Uncharacterized protein n=1 Tax=Aliiglaciecola litoralis TaxID=582857 RepID=A0ABP3WUA6_9ALTE